MDAAQTVSEWGVISEPHAVKVSPMLPGPFSATVEEAYTAVKALLDPDLTYRISFQDNGGGIIQRYSRMIPAEAWLVARPVDENDRPLPTKDRIVFPIAVDVLALADEDRKTLADKWIAELDALKEADGV